MDIYAYVGSLYTHIIVKCIGSELPRNEAKLLGLFRWMRQNYGTATSLIVTKDLFLAARSIMLIRRPLELLSNAGSMSLLFQLFILSRPVSDEYEE